jgi:hypothetical protein
MEMTAMENGKNESSIRLAKSVRETINQDGAVLLDIKQGLCFSMNPVGAKIWEMLKQGCPPEAIVDGLEKEFEGVSRGELEMDVTDLRLTSAPPNLQGRRVQSWENKSTL